MRLLLILLAAVPIVVACEATPVQPQAQSVELVNDAPDRNKCRYLGEVAGSQGNWLTGDFTSNKNLAVGARNELRNEAQKLGGNVVHVQDMKNTNAWGSAGTTNTTAVGKVYACKG